MPITSRFPPGGIADEDRRLGVAEEVTDLGGGVGGVQRQEHRPRPHHHAHALHSPYWWLKCAVGTTNDSHPLVRAYHNLLVWDMLKAPRITRVTERLLNPLIGKSVVVYLRKPRNDGDTG